MNKEQKLHKYLQENKQLFWDVDQKKIYNLTDESIIERIFEYGDMQDFAIIKDTYGSDYLYEIFKKITSKKRVNLRKETINFFNLYLQYNAS